jgi:hypothetical protein
LQRGGVDLPRFRNSEAALVAFDFGSANQGLPDGEMDIIVGYPPQASDDSERFPCNAAMDVFDVTCFGIYLYSGAGLDSINTRFRYVSSSPVLPHSSTDYNQDTNSAKVSARAHTHTHTHCIFFC